MSEWNALCKILAAFLSSACFGVIFHIRGRNILFAGISGALGFACYLSPLAQSTQASIFLASCAITLYAESMARIRKSPATVFLVAGLIPIVPGSGMYRCMYQALEGDLSQAAMTCYSTLLEAGSIAIGVVTITSLMRIATGVRSLRAQRRRV